MAGLSRSSRRTLFRAAAVAATLFIMYRTLGPAQEAAPTPPGARNVEQRQPRQAEVDDAPGAGLGDDAPPGARAGDPQQDVADEAPAGAAQGARAAPGAHMDRDTKVYPGASHTRMHGTQLGMKADGSPGWTAKPCPENVNMRKELLANGFFARRSDCLPLDRDIPDFRHAMCKRETYDLDTLPTTSVIFVFYNVGIPRPILGRKWQLRRQGEQAAGAAPVPCCGSGVGADIEDAGARSHPAVALTGKL